MLSLRSKVIQKILNYYFLNPEEEVYINELARMLDLDPRNTEVKLKELEREGLFESEFRGKQRYYFLAKNSPVLEHYQQIFLKTLGIENNLKEQLSMVEGLTEAYLFGSYASNTMDPSSDIDLLAVGDHSVLELQKIISKMQKNTGRVYNVVNMGAAEFESKKNTKDPLLDQIFKQKNIRVV